MSPFKDARAMRSAALAATGLIELPRGNSVPVTANDACAAGMTVGALSCLVMNVAGVDVTQPRPLRNFPCERQCGRRRSRHIAHSPIGVKRREMERHVGAEPIHDPFRERADLGRAVIVAGDQQRRDLEPDAGHPLNVLQRLKDRIQLSGAEGAIEAVGEGLQVDVDTSSTLSIEPIYPPDRT